MPKVFISYRREDAAGYAQAVYGQLERHLGRNQIFMDVDTVEPGVDFVARIEQAVSESDVVIALIGNRWMGTRENAPARIHDPQDFVHLEIAAALTRKIRIIPVLVDGASMPSKDGLPPSLQPIVRRNAVELSNTRFRFDLERVSQAVQKALVRTTVAERIERLRPWMWYCGLSVVLIVLGISVNLWFQDGEDKQATTKTVTALSPLPSKQPQEEEQAQRKKADELRRKENLERERAELQRKIAEAKRQLQLAESELERLKSFRSKQRTSSKELDDEIKLLEQSLNQMKSNTSALQSLKDRI